MEERLLDMITDSIQYFDEETIMEIMHFYRHDEYEMALEGLIIELMKIQKYPPHFSYEEINKLVLHYHLNVESVFEYNFWEKYLDWRLYYLSKMK